MKKPERRYSDPKAYVESQQNRGFASQAIKLPGKIKMFKPDEGTMYLDIIPYITGDANPQAEEGLMHWEMTYYVHRNVGAGSDTYTCPRMTFKEKCPICEHRRMLTNDDKEGNEEMIKALAPKQRQLLNVINTKKPNDGIMLWDVSTFLFTEELVKRLEAADEDEKWGNFYFLEGGFTLRILFGEDSFAGHKFLKADSIDFKPRREDLDESIMEECVCLDQVIINTPYKELKRALLELGNEGEDEDDKPSSKATKKSKKNDDDDAPADPDDDDAPPARGKKSKDDDDDDAPPEDKRDDDDDAPRSKKSAREEDPDDDDAPPSKKKPKDDDGDPDDDDAPKSKKGKPSRDDDDDRPAKRREADPDDDDAPAPKSKKSKKDDDDDVDMGDAPAKKRDWNKFEDAPKSKKSAREEDPDDDDAPAPKSKKPVRR